MSDTQREQQEEEDRLWRVHKRFCQAVEIVRDANTEKNMTLTQSMCACYYIASALQLSQEQFADAVLAEAGLPYFFLDLSSFNLKD